MLKPVGPDHALPPQPPDVLGTSGATVCHEDNQSLQELLKIVAQTVNRGQTAVQIVEMAFQAEKKQIVKTAGRNFGEVFACFLLDSP